MSTIETAVQRGARLAAAGAGRPRKANGVMEVDRSGLEILDHQECLRLLATTTLGRLGITNGALPVIVPISFRLVSDRIVFRTTVGTKLDSATRRAIVAFEADRFEPASGTGWNVSVTGSAGEVTDPDELAELAHADIPRWTRWGTERFIAISTERVSGRRFPLGSPLLRNEPCGGG